MLAAIPVEVNTADLYETFEEMKTDTLRSLLYATTAGTLLWYLWDRVSLATGDSPVKDLSIVPIVLLEGAVYALLSKHRRAAIGVYLVGALFVITAGIWLFEAPGAMFLYCLLTLAAVVISRLEVGLAVACLATAAGYLVTLHLPKAAPVSHVPDVALFSLIAMVISWALLRNFSLAVRWSLASYRKARESLETVRERRAEVIHLNQELNHARERLEHANAALVRAWRTAEEAQRRQQQTAAFIGHELRTPLNLVIGFSEMLVNSPEAYALHGLPPKARRDLDSIYRGAQQLGALVDDVLDMASVDEGHLALVREPSELWGVILEAVSLIRDYVEAKNLELRLVRDGELPLLVMDPLRVRQVLLNLLVNAARFTDEGSITVRAIAVDRCVRVEITDTGRGIPGHDAESIFQEFHPTERGHSLWDKGTGLGLPLSRKLIHLHSGEMGVESDVGNGSTFWFTLPLDGGLPDQERPVLVRRVTQPVRRPGTEPTLVVLEEDELAVRRLRRWLHGYHLVSAHTWEDAIVQSQAHLAVALLADSHTTLPEDVNSLPIIRCSLPTTRRSAERLGVAAYLEKPVTEARLLGTLQRVAPEATSVLVVDDDERFVQLVTRMLEKTIRDCDVIVAYDGVEALRRLGEQEPDVMLLDLLLPALDGWQLLKEIARRERFAGIPIIVVSASPAERETVSSEQMVVVSQAGESDFHQVIRLLKAVLPALSPDSVEAAPSAPEPRAGSPG